MIYNKECIECGNIFQKKTNCSIANWGTTKFCSPKCYWLSLKGKPSFCNEKLNRDKICEYCKEIYTLNKRGKTWELQKFCSNKCQGLAFSGENNQFFGHSHTAESIAKNRDKHVGKVSWNKGIYGEEHHGWKGGHSVSRSRSIAKRRDLGCIALNSKDSNNWDGHHINKEYIIYIPRELHQSIGHSVIHNRNMDKINQVVYDWIGGHYQGDTKALLLKAIRTSDA